MSPWAQPGRLRRPGSSLDTQRFQSQADSPFSRRYVFKQTEPAPPSGMTCSQFLPRFALAWMLAGLGCASPAQASEALHFLCEWPDGNQRWVAQDLSQHFPDTVTRCEAVRLETTPFEPREEVLLSAAGETRAVGPSMSWTMLLGLAQPTLPRPLPAERTQMMPLVHTACARQGLDCHLVHAIIDAESGFRNQARSPKGAMGLMQVMPATGQRYGVARADALLDPATNLDVGTRYLRDLLALFGGRLDLAVAAYNAGEGAVIRHGRRIPPYPETQGYVRRVLATLEKLKSSGPGFGGAAGTSPAAAWNLKDRAR